MKQSLISRLPENRHTQLTYRYGCYLVAHARLFLFLPLLVCLLATSGLIYLKSTPDSRIFFSKDNPQLKALESMENTFSKSDNAFIAFQSKSGTIFNETVLSMILELTEAAWQVPFSNRVMSLSNHQRVSADDDAIIVGDLFDAESDLSASGVSRIESYVMNKPAILNRMVSIDGAVSAVNITVQKPSDQPDAVFTIIEHVRGLVSRFEKKYPDINFYITGGTAFDAAFTEVPVADNQILGPIMIVVILLILGISLRSFWFVLVAIALIGLAVGTMLGLTGWYGARMNAGTAGAPVIVLTLSVAYCVHVLVTIRQQILLGLDKTEAIIESLRVNVSPVAITGLTTAIGFLSLNFSDAPPFRQLGNMVALGVIVTFILSITFLPAFLSLLKLSVSGQSQLLSGIMYSLASLVVRFRKALLLVTSVAIVLLSLGSMRIVLDDNFIEYFDQRYRLRTDTDFIEQRLTGMNALEYPLNSGESGGVLDPQYLQTVENFETWLKQQPKVTSTVSVVEVLKDLNRSMQGGDDAYHRVPESRELAAQLMLLYEMSLAPGQDLNYQVDIDKRSSRVVALVRGASSADLRRLNARAEDWLSENTSILNAQGSGLSLVFAYISGRNINSMLFGSLFALVVISFILIFALRSWKLGLLSLAPNLFPAAMALGAWGYYVGTAGLAVAVVVAITLGIVVDDTVHFLSKYLRARRELHYEPAEAVHFAFSTVGVALWITSVTLVAGFIVLSLSGFRVTAEMGLLSAVTIALALLADFLFLPALLLQIDKSAAIDKAV